MDAFGFFMQAVLIKVTSSLRLHLPPTPINPNIPIDCVPNARSIGGGGRNNLSINDYDPARYFGLWYNAPPWIRRFFWIEAELPDDSLYAHNEHTDEMYIEFAYDFIRLGINPSLFSTCSGILSGLNATNGFVFLHDDYPDFDILVKWEKTPILCNMQTRGIWNHNDPGIIHEIDFVAKDVDWLIRNTVPLVP
jgi:hypothetical protein